MKKYFTAIIIASMLLSPMAIAEETFAGLSLGQVEFSEDVEAKTTNLGLVLGQVNETGFGYELFYSLTLDDDESTDFGFEVEADSDILGVFAIYKTPGDVYFKVKAGYSLVSLHFDFEDGDSANDTSDGFSYGLAIGAQLGGGALELSYYKFADFDDFSALKEELDELLIVSPVGNEALEAEVEMLNLNYVYRF